MADFEGLTSSNGVNVTDIEAVKNILAEYQVSPDCDYILDTEGRLGFWGWDWLEVLPMRQVEGGDLDEREPDYEYMGDGLDDLLKLLQPYIPEEEELVIHLIGSEKVRFPFAAMAIYVTQKKILYIGLPESSQGLSNLRIQIQGWESYSPGRR